MKPAMRTLLPLVAMLLAAGTAAVAEVADLGSGGRATTGGVRALIEGMAGFISAVSQSEGCT